MSNDDEYSDIFDRSDIDGKENIRSNRNIQY